MNDKEDISTIVVIHPNKRDNNNKWYTIVMGKLKTEWTKKRTENTILEKLKAILTINEKVETRTHLNKRGETEKPYE